MVSLCNNFNPKIEWSKIAELEAGDTAVLPELSSYRDEEVLGRYPGEAARDERGGDHVGGDRHVEGWGNDPP